MACKQCLSMRRPFPNCMQVVLLEGAAPTDIQAEMFNENAISYLDTSGVVRGLLPNDMQAVLLKE